MGKTLTAAADAVRSLDRDQILIAAAAAAIILPDICLGGIIAAITVFILLSPGRRKLLSRSPAAFMLVPLLLVLLVPGALSRSGFSILTGSMVWLIMTFSFFAAEVMTSVFYSFILDALLAGSAFAAVFGVFCQLTGRLELGRVASFFENPNHYAYAIELFVLIALCQYTRTRKAVYLAAAAVNILMNLLCDCRTAWLAILAGVIVYGVFTIKRSWFVPAAAASGAGLLLLLSCLPFMGKRLTAESISHSFDNRVRYWANAVRWFKRRPLIGWGTASYTFLSEAEGERILFHAHNMVLNILLDTGIIGSVIILTAFAVWIRNLFRPDMDPDIVPFRNLAFAAIAATLVHGVTDFPLLGVSTSLVFMLILSVCGCAAGREKRARNEAVPPRS